MAFVPLPLRPKILQTFLLGTFLGILPLVLAIQILGLAGWDLSIPLIYRNADDIWQLTLTKVLRDTGWVLTNPYLGAPEVASWHHNAAAQTSALHSVLMLALSSFIHDPVRLQQVYYLLNFPLICLTSFVACRLVGIARLPAICVGLLFAFTTFRIEEMLYAFLSNYFMVPLALVAVIWVLSGRFTAFFEGPDASSRGWDNLGRLLRSRDFLLGLIFVALTAACDGYYAFFTLLLLGFATFARAIAGDWRRPLALVPAGIYIASLMAISLALMLPLHSYKKSHWNEFYPNGVQDPVLIKHPFEAEVYSSSLKLLVAPITYHRIESWGNFGKWMVETSDGARLYKNGRNLVPLGTLGTLLFCAALVLLAFPALRRNSGAPASFSWRLGEGTPSPVLHDALLSLTLFVFLGSIVGGIGTLVALIFPTIRSYDRFPLFMIFALYLGAASLVTTKLRNAGWRRRATWSALTLLVTAAALYDQIPRDSRKGDEKSKAQFLAERDFVRKIEAELPSGAMVYQYPYSQYLRENKYYGWGSFSHIRLYLHSRELRWSNGGAKNSPADDWNYRVSQLPLDKLITEVEAVGFAGFVMDRTVLTSGAYQAALDVIGRRGYEKLEDAASNFTFVRLRDPGFRLVYDKGYREADRIVITSPARLTGSDFPALIDGEAIKRFVRAQPHEGSNSIAKADRPELFTDGAMLARGLGQVAITPASDMRGQLTCRVEAGPEADGAADGLLLTLSNQSRFDWKLNDGPFPIRIGVHIRTPDGELVRWDDGFRIPTDAYIARGASRTIRVSFSSLSKPVETRGRGPLMAEFALVQDGVAWFGDISCAVPLP